MKTSEVLEEVKALITPPKAWIKGSYAMNDEGSVVGSTSPDATCYCLAGAVRMVTNYEPGTRKVLMYLHTVINGSIEVFNDDESTTHQMVLDVVSKAITAAKQDEDAEAV